MGLACRCVPDTKLSVEKGCTGLFTSLFRSFTLRILPLAIVLPCYPISKESTMTTATPTDSPLSQLQSEAQVQLLDAIDRVRRDGFQWELDLPQIIVCGDQSSGKSSVLEAISGVRFPASDRFRTRFASELSLRRSTESSFRVTIRPASHRSEDSYTRHISPAGISQKD